MRIEKIYFENQGEKIEGILHLPEREINSLIILVHGFTGTMDGPGGLFIKLAKELANKDFVVLRFNFRFTSEDFSQFHKMTIGGEVSDLKLIIDEMSKRFSRIGLLGESMGGSICILAYNEKVKCLVLWYPAIFPKETDLGKRFLSKEAEKELKETGFIKGKKSDGREYKVGKEFVEELKNIDLVPYFERIGSPTLLIHGERDAVAPFSHSERLFRLLKCQKKLIKILKVCHAFKNKDFTTDYNLKAQQKAIELTVKWFEKWLK
jgi:dienelactone hydrolase